MTINFSLVLPCYNEEKNISHLFEEFQNLKLRKSDVVELIFVNNGSTDNTRQEIIKVLKKNKKKKIIIRHITLKNNLGYGGGIKTGLDNSNGNFIGWCHADLQTPLEDFYNLYKKIKKHKNVFGKGIRKNNRGYDGIVSRLHEKTASLILGKNMVEINAQPKIFHKSLYKIFKNIPTKWTTIDTYFYYIALKNKLKIIEIDVTFKTRIYGESKWKNNFKTFFQHIFFNFIYLIKLKLA
jgi:glycosyltransferase involved in cell wall biosynthesis